VVGGDKDIVTKLEANRRIADSAPQGDLHVVDGANHLGPMECAELYNKLISDFALAVQPAVSADMPARPAAGAPAAPAQRSAAGPHQRPDARPY
jgi:hypothetical protein